VPTFVDRATAHSRIRARDCKFQIANFGGSRTLGRGPVGIEGFGEEEEMALIQALFAFIGKSAGKILSAVFGWAVIALFGQTSPKQHTLLSGLVGARCMATPNSSRCNIGDGG
jgi:hypothetical protein